jgi:hypothetical protein
MISEIYKYRIQELAGILSEDNAPKLARLGFTEQAAKVFVDIDDKLAMFFANLLTREFAKSKGVSEEDAKKKDIKDILSMIDQDGLIYYVNARINEINLVLDWIKSPFRREVLNLKTIESFPQALEMAHQWHNSMEATGIINDESGDIVKRYPNGYYWIDLKTNSSSEESQAMGHCGTDGRATTLFSFRDKNKSPHVTIAYNANNKSVLQVKGRGNKRPIDEYMKYVYDFLKELSDTGNLNNFVWSYGNDLNMQDVKMIFGNDKYGEYVYNHLINDRGKLGLTPQEIRDAIGIERYKEYIYKMLDKALEKPLYVHLETNPEELVAIIGEEEYNKFLYTIINKIIDLPSFYGTEKLIGVLKNNYNIDLTQDQIKNIIGAKKMFFFLKNSMDAEKSNLFVRY